MRIKLPLLHECDEKKVNERECAFPVSKDEEIVGFFLPFHLLFLLQSRFYQVAIHERTHQRGENKGDLWLRAG